MGSRALRVRRPAGVSSRFAESLPSARYRRSFHTGAGRGPVERRSDWRLRSRATCGATSCRSLIASASRASGALRREARPRMLAAIASSPHPATSRQPVSASDHPQTGCNSPIGHTRSATTTSSPRQPPPPVLRWRAIRSVSFPRRPLDPGEQDGPPSTSLEGLDAMGRWAQEHQVVHCAAAPHPEATRCPDVVELKLTEAVVRDPELHEDATAVTRPHLRPHIRRDRTWRAGNAAPMSGRVATQHRPSTL
jgi:hypothetical protein